MPPKPTPAEIESVSVDDYLLPKTMIQRLAKGVLPANTQIQKDALTALLKSTTVFVSYLANNANDRAVLGNHKTIKPEDVIEALKEMEFEHFVPRVTKEHDRFVEIQNTKRNDYRKRVKDENATDAVGDAPGSGSERREADGRDSPPAAKKARISLTNTASGMDNESEMDIGEEEEDEEIVDDEVSDDAEDADADALGETAELEDHEGVETLENLDKAHDKGMSDSEHDDEDY